MKQKKYKKSIVGRRTGVHIVVLDKTLKLNEDGFESFGDYWPSSSSSRDGSVAYMNSSPVNPDVKRISSFVKNIKNITGEQRESISFINPSKSTFLDKQSNVEFAHPHLVASKPPKSRKPYTKGRRTGADVISGKEILVNENMEDFKGYWTATKSNFDTEINGTDTDKVSISDESKSCRSDFDTGITSKTLRKCSYKNSPKERSVVKAVRADSTFSPAPSNLNSPKNLTLNNFKTFKALYSDSIANSEVTSTSVDGNKSKGLCNMVTPAAVRRHSPRISSLSKNDARVNLHGKIVKRIPFLEVGQNSVLDCKSSNSDDENHNNEIPKTQDHKSRNAELKKTVENCEINSEPNQNCSDKDTINPNMETQKTEDCTFRTTDQNLIRIKSCEIQTISSNKLFSKLEAKNKNGNCKNNLSTSRKKIETNCMSSSNFKNHETHYLDSNLSLSNDEAESAKEKTKHPQAQKEQTFSLPSSVSFHNNEMNRTHTLVNYMSIIELPEGVHSNQIENLQRSSKSKSQTRKNKVYLSSSKNIDKSDSISFSSQIEKQKKKNSLVIEKDKIHSLASNSTFSQDEAEENANKQHTIRKDKINLSTSIKRDKSDSISFTSETKKQKTRDSSVIKSDRIPSIGPNSIRSQDVAKENTNKKTKYSETRKEEIISLHNNKMTGIQTSGNNVPSTNSPEALCSNQTSKAPKSTASKSQRRKHKNNLSTSRNTVETDCLSSLDTENEVESTNEDTKHSESKKQEISLPTCLSPQNNEKTLTQTFINNTFKINSPEPMHLSQIARNQKSTESKSRTGNSKYDLSTSRQTHEIDKETTLLSQNKTIDKPVSKALLKANKPKQKKRKSDSNHKSKSKKSKSDNVETKNDCSQMPALRRSKRDRIPPLESWRLERRVFGFRDGELVSLGYEKGFTEDQRDIDVVKKPKPIKKKPQRKDLKLNENSVNKELIKSNIEKISCTNPYTGEEELLNLHRPYDTLLWSVPPAQDETDPSYTLSKSMSSELISFGYIEIGVKKKKNKQYSPTDNINLTVYRGKVKVSINNQQLKLSEKDTITVPAGNGYSVKNTGKIPALLGYCTFKVPFFDYQFGDYSETA